jgi:hypothetical protein
MGFATGHSTPSASERKAYDELFDDKLTTSNIEALDALLNDARKDRADNSGDARPPLRFHRCAYFGCIPFV